MFVDPPCRTPAAARVGSASQTAQGAALCYSPYSLRRLYSVFRLTPSAAAVRSL